MTIYYHAGPDDRWAQHIIFPKKKKKGILTVIPATQNSFFTSLFPIYDFKHIDLRSYTLLLKESLLLRNLGSSSISSQLGNAIGVSPAGFDHIQVITLIVVSGYCSGDFLSPHLFGTVVVIFLCSSFLLELKTRITMEPLNICSLNVNGLNSPAKRRAIFKTIRDGNYDVALLQETHCTTVDERIWAAEWGGKNVFFQW